MVLQGELSRLEARLGILRRLAALQKYRYDEELIGHNVLNIVKTEAGELSLEVYPFRSRIKAIEKAIELEDKEHSINTVYVHASDPNQLKTAYRNYFNDPVAFVQLLGRCMSRP